MRMVVLGLIPLVGCSVPDDNVTRELDAFETPRVELRRLASGGFTLDVSLTPKDAIGSPCPVLPDATAMLGSSSLTVTSSGGYDALTARCGDVAWNLPLVPDERGAKVEIATVSESRLCSLRDAHLSQELELRDGGDWTRPSAEGTLAFRFVDTMIAPPSVIVSLTPFPSGPTVSLESTTAADVHTIELPMLAAQPYTLHIEAPPVTLVTACTILAEPFADQRLTIVE